MASGVGKYLERLYHDLVLGPRGYGRAPDKSVWEAQYRRGEWAALEGLDEMAHYAIIGGYTRLLHPSPAILDAGCGHGGLWKWVNPNFESYLGVDVATEAIAQANTTDNPKASFVAADLASWETPRRFDLIIFNESLYYLPDPRATVVRFDEFLNPGGSFIISICQHGHNAAVWSRLDETMEWIHGTEARNYDKRAWEIRAGRVRTSAKQA
jgi:SAM-dependent methyltransferase